MRVRDMHLYMCEICWAALVLCGFGWAGITLIAVFMLFAGAWVPFAWVGGTSVVYGGVVFVIAYFEARSHWKIKEEGRG